MQKQPNFISRLLHFLFVLPSWIAFGFLVSVVTWLGLQTVGLVKIPVPVSGPSMLPTLNEQGYVSFRRYPKIDFFKPEIHRGDIVVFENSRTREESKKRGRKTGGFVKRAIGLPGDEIFIRDGYVYVNGEKVVEPYTLKSRSTFGSTDLRDCQKVKVPQNELFVLGDNRKISFDSRNMGLISFTDLQFYLNQADQTIFSNRWRNTTHDNDQEQRSEFDRDLYLTLLNQKRREAGLKNLVYSEKLTASAQKRANIMLRFDDFSFEATKSGYTMNKAMKESGYSNIVYGEFPVLGYYDARELIDSFFEQTESKNFLLGKDYQDVGISTFVGVLQGCPVQIVVQHLAGYVPPNYKASDIQSWRDALGRLNDVKPGWEKLKNYKEFYEKHTGDVDRINELIRIRTERIQKIVQRMEANEWLTEQEKQYVTADKTLYEEQNAVAERLNKATSE